MVKLDMTKFLGRHEIKLGGDYELVNSLSENYQGGAGQRIYQIRQASTGIVYYRHRYYVDDLAPGFNRDDPSTWQIALPQVAEPRTKGFSAYLQDSWKVTPYFTLNLGLRWEKQDVQNRFSESAFKLDDNWAPRLGFIWDVSKSGKSKLYANYGRFYENIPQDINIRAFGGEAVCFCYNFSANPADIASVRRNAVALVASRRRQHPVDPDLKGQYIDEYLGGFEYEVAPNFVLGDQGHLPQPRPRDRGLPGHRRGRLLHRQPRGGDARPDPHVLRLLDGSGRPGRSVRTGASSSPRASASRTTGSSSRATSGPSSRATTTASSRTRPASSTRTSTRPSTTPTS